MKEEFVNPHIHVLTGSVQGGKTSQAAKYIALLKERGIRVMGFLCPGLIADGKRTEFNLMNIQTGQEVPMGHLEEVEGWMKYRRFYFNPEAFSLGAEWIEEAVKQQADLLVIDEVGPMELEGLGWSSMLQVLEHKTELMQLWLVREQILPEVAERWKIRKDQIVKFESLENLTKKWM